MCRKQEGQATHGVGLSVITALGPADNSVKTAHETLAGRTLWSEAPAGRLTMMSP